MEKISENVWKFSRTSNVYFLNLSKKILIDTGDNDDRQDLIDSLAKIKINPEDVKIVIFTHLHYDHSGNFDLFKNTEFYASGKEIKAFNENPNGAVLNKKIAGNLSIQINKEKIKLIDASELNIPELKIINTPGHTKGSISIFYESGNVKEKKILFSGDTLFRGCHGRTDLPTSIPAEMEKSLKKITKLNYDILCSGHDY